MKIIIDARLYGLENAGLGRYVINLIKGICKKDKNHQYTIFLRKKYFNRLNLPANFKKICVDVRHYSFLEQIVIPYHIFKEKPDLVHFPHFNVPLICPSKYVVTIHDLLMHKSKGKKTTTLPFIEYFLKRFFYSLVFANAVKKSSAILVPSEFIKKEILHYYKISSDKIIVTYEGVDIPDEFGKKENINLPKPYFVYVGNAYPHKNLENAVQAIMLLNKEVKAYFYVVSSRNVFTRRLEDLIKEKKAANFVKLLGFVEDRKLFEIYRNSAGFLYPSFSEGFGLPGLEAMIGRTLCIASDIEVFKEIYKDNAVYFDPDSPTDMKNKLLEALFMEPDQKEKLISKAFSFAKGYSWDTMAEKTLDVYENCNRLRQGK